MNALQSNARDLAREFDWLAQLLDARFKRFFQQEEEVAMVADIAPPDLRESDSPFADFVRQHKMAPGERAVLALALAASFKPQLLDIFLLKNQQFDRKFSEFGGQLAGAGGDFLPTVETALFLLAESLAERFALLALFEPEHDFSRQQVLRLAHGPDENLLKAPLRLADEFLSLFSSGRPRQPVFGVQFPARLIETPLQWGDLVLHPATREQVKEIGDWIRHSKTLLQDWGMAKKLRPGFRSLFYGPPGTGKTMTACLLGKASGLPVYKIDLSLVVSKYIGETEKNLARVFDQAEHRGWILFFDEADALFGKRSEVRDAHDRYANQETAFLLQRLETFDGIAILASNLRNNLDEAFSRRFESMIYFPLPRPEERILLWRQNFPSGTNPDPRIDLVKIAHDYELSGSAIMNAIRYAALQALSSGSGGISLEDVKEGIRREYVKEGRAI